MRVELRDVNKYYNRGKDDEVHALKQIDFEMRQGEMVCLRGPSGSGKSTLLSIIGCIFPPTSGRAEISGKQLSRLPDHFLTRHRRENIGFIFQRFNLIESLSVVENITLPLLPLGVSPAARKIRAESLLRKLNILHRQRFRANQISGGELQRVAIARALICDPPLIVADEPTAHLDANLSHQFMEIMSSLQDEGKTIVLTSHDPIICGHGRIDRLLEMSRGRITGEVVD